MTGVRLSVDWLACDGHGVCAELLPEVVDLDDWGFPVLHSPVADADPRAVRAAVAACPALALRLTRS